MLGAGIVRCLKMLEYVLSLIFTTDIIRDLKFYVQINEITLFI